MISYVDGLMQKRRNSIANALELCLFTLNLWYSVLRQITALKLATAQLLLPVV